MTCVFFYSDRHHLRGHRAKLAAPIHLGLYLFIDKQRAERERKGMIRRERRVGGKDKGDRWQHKVNVKHGKTKGQNGSVDKLRMGV